MPIFQASYIGLGVTMQTPTSQSPANSRVPSFNTDGTFGGWLIAGGPAGSGTELQYRSSSTALGAVTGSSWDGTTLTIPNLTVTGTTTTVSTTNLTVSDPLIKLATGNAADLIDVGFYGLYTSSGAKYTGLFRDASDSGKYKLFTALQEEPTTTVNVAGTGYAAGTLVVGTLEGNLTGNVTGSISGGTVSGSSFTNSGLTSGRVPYSSTGGLEADSGNFTWNNGTNTLAVTGAVTGTTFNGVALTTGGSATAFLNGAGSYASVPANVSSLNGLTGALSIAVGTSGTDFAVSAAGSTVTLNLPDAGAAARGAVTTGAQTLAGAKLFTGLIGVGATDSSIGRNAAGVVEINSGTAITSAGANARDLMLRSLLGASVSGNNVAGPTLYIAPSQSSGSATPGSIVLQGTVAGGSGSTAQTLADVMTVTNGRTSLVGVTEVFHAAGTSGKGFRISNHADYTDVSGINAALNAYNPIHFRATGGTLDQFVIYNSSSGYVGVNQATPTAQLHVVAFDSTSTAGLFVGATSHSATPLRINLGSTPSANAFTITSSGGSEGGTFKVAIDGNVTSGASFIATSHVQAGSSGYVGYSNRALIYSPSDGILELTNNAGNDFSRLQFGGTTSSFPAIKRSSATLAFRLADDSADCAISASTGTFSGNVSVTDEAYGSSWNGSTNVPTKNAVYDKIQTIASDVLFDHSADSTVGGAEADIYTDTLAVSQLANNLEKIVATYSGNFVTLGTESVQLLVKFAGTTIWDSTGIAVSVGTTSWAVAVEIIRVSSTVIRYAVRLSTSGASGFVYCSSGELTGLTLSNTNILKITGASSGVGSGSGDIIGKMGWVEFKPAA